MTKLLTGKRYGLAVVPGNDLFQTNENGKNKKTTENVVVYIWKVHAPSAQRHYTAFGRQCKIGEPVERLTHNRHDTR